jgi:hypothetical protein
MSKYTITNSSGSFVKQEDSTETSPVTSNEDEMRKPMQKVRKPAVGRLGKTV